MTDSRTDLLETRWSKLGMLHGAEAEVGWNWFVERYRDFVRDVLASVLRTRELVDAAEEDFWGYLYLSGTLNRADRARRFRALLFGTTRNFARAWSRKRGLGQIDENALRSLEAVDDAGGAATVAWVDSVIHHGLRALAQEHALTARCISLFYGIGSHADPRGPRSASDVAAAIDNTTQAVYMMLFRGRQRMRQLVTDEVREGCGDEDALREELQLLLRVAASRLPGLVE